MNLKFNYIQMDELPKLAWLVCYRRKKELTAYHGRSVECHPHFMVEGVWDGEFSKGDFYKSESFFGSGVQIVGENLICSATSSNQDRILFCQDGDKIVISNSLPVILAYTGARLDENHDYFDEHRSILEGIKKYKREFRIIHPDIKSFYQIFYENIIITPDDIRFEFRGKHHTYKSYDDYMNKLTTFLEKMRENYEDHARKYPIAAFTTISSGYDSTAVTCLVRNLGVKTCFTAKRSNSWLPSFFDRAVDNGAAAIEAIGGNTAYMYHDKYIGEDELYFLSTLCSKVEGEFCSEIIFHSISDYIESNKDVDVAVVFNGNHGDVVWGLDLLERFLTDDIIKTDQSGMGLMEIRLKSGYINIAVPFLMAINLREIYEVSKSDELIPWKLNNSYDRPIARRIAETAGVKRGDFGTRKKAVVTFYQYPINRALRKSFFQFIEQRYGIPPYRIHLSIWLNRIPKITKMIAKKFGFPSVDYHKNYFYPELHLPFLMWIWSTHTLSDQFATVFRNVEGLST